MDKKAIKKELDEVLIQLKNNSKDAKFADKLIDKAMSLKGQLDVEEVDFIKTAKEVDKVYDFGNYKFTKYKDGSYGFHSYGFDTFVSPILEGTNQRLSTTFEVRDSVSEYPEIDASGLDFLIAQFAIIFQIPQLAILTDDYCKEYTEAHLKNLEKFQQMYMDAELQEENHEENAKFENDMQLAEQVMLGEKNERTIG